MIISRLRPLPPRKLIRVLKELGWEEHHQTGSHLSFRHPNYPDLRIVVPIHSTISTGVIYKIIKKLDMTVEEFMRRV
ncbi:MAG: type II toxin-antitoxin system HicA family toxin [Promethearchaeota archaeon]